MIKKLYALFFALAACAALCSAQTVPQTGAPLNLNLPPYQYPHYDVPVNQNFNTINSWANSINISLTQLFKGTYSPSQTYGIGQSVVLSGDYYISAIANNMANTPTHSSSQWVWVATINSSAALPVGIPFTVNVGGVLTTATMTVANLDSIYGTTPGSDLCWLDNTGACSVPPEGYIPPDKVPYRDPTTHASATATAAQMASMFMQLDGATACTDGVLMGDGHCYPLNLNQDVTADSNGKITSLPDRGVSCTGGEPQTCTVAWSEDPAHGIFSPLRPRTFDNAAGSPVTLQTDCTQSIINTINAAVCANHANANISPIVKLPAGHYSGCGKNTQLPPGITMIGQAGTGGGDYGGATFLQSGDATQPMYVMASSYTATCGGTPVTTTGGAQRFEHISLNGFGATNTNDVGLIDNGQGSAYIYDDAFSNFGGPGVQMHGLNSHGDKIFGFGNLWCFYFCGTYNPTSFADTNWHGGLELNNQDGQYDHIVQYGALQDSGWYNRFYLVGVLTPGGPSGRIEDSFIQINPHNLVGIANSDGGRRIHHNRLDDSWFSSIQTQFFGNAHIGDNDITGYCTSPLLNPANFGTNPVPGTSPDPNCSGIYQEDGGNSYIYWNTIGEAAGVWPAWPTYQIYLEPNNTGQENQAAGVVEQPGDSVGGYYGSNWCCGNQGGDASRSIIYTTFRMLQTGPITNGTIALGPHVGANVETTNTSTWNNITSQYADYVARIFLSSKDSIVPSATVSTCGGQTLTGSDTSIFGGGTTGYEFWMRDQSHATQLNCPVTPSPVFAEIDPVDTACVTSDPSLVYGFGFASSCNLDFGVYLPLVKQDFVSTRFDEYPASTPIKGATPLTTVTSQIWGYSNLVTDAWQFQSGGGVQYTGTLAAAGDDLAFINGNGGGDITIRASVVSSGQAGELAFRITDASNFVALRWDASGNVTLISMHLGTPTTLFTGTHAFTGGPINIGLHGQSVGGTYNNGTSSYNVTGTIPAGVNTNSPDVGVGAWTTSANAVKFNNLIVSNE